MTNRDELVQRLRTRHRRLLLSYLGFLSLFISTGAMAAVDASSTVLLPAILTVLAATVPVIILNIALHRAIRAVKPSARSIGAKQAVFSALVFTPFEAALLLPVVNLWVSHVLLRECGAQQAVPRDVAASRRRP